MLALSRRRLETMASQFPQLHYIDALRQRLNGSAQVSEGKLNWIRQYGGRIQRVGQNPLDAEVAARSAAAKEGKTYISPYNDPQVVAGQGTIAHELCRQLTEIDAVYVAVGGAALLADSRVSKPSVATYRGDWLLA